MGQVQWQVPVQVQVTPPSQASANGAGAGATGATGAAGACWGLLGLAGAIKFQGIKVRSSRKQERMEHTLEHCTGRQGPGAHYCTRPRPPMTAPL